MLIETKVKTAADNASYIPHYIGPSQYNTSWACLKQYDQ